MGPGLVLVALDTVQPAAAGGHVGARQLEWLDRTLAEAEGKSVIVAAYHQLQSMSPLDESDLWLYKTVDNAADVRAVLEKHSNVVAVLAGDAHSASSRAAGRILYLSSPSLGIWPLAYHLLQLRPREIETAWVPAAPDALVHRAEPPAGKPAVPGRVPGRGGRRYRLHPPLRRQEDGSDSAAHGGAAAGAEKTQADKR